MVHRLLAAALGLEPLPESARDEDSLHGVTDNLNTRHRNAIFHFGFQTTYFVDDLIKKL